MSAGTRLQDAVLRPIREGYAFESTIEQLAGAIRLGVFADGDQLPPERELAERLGVSRDDAARGDRARCASRGWSRPVAGAAAAPSSSTAGWSPAAGRRRRCARGAALADALDFRRVVEPGAAQLAAGRGARPPTSGPGSRASPRRGPRGPRHRRPTGWPTAAAPGHRHPVRVADAHRGRDPRAGGAARAARRRSRCCRSTSRTPTTSTTPSSRRSSAATAATARAAMEEHCDATAALLRGLLG